MRKEIVRQVVAAARQRPARCSPAVALPAALVTASREQLRPLSPNDLCRLAWAVAKLAPLRGGTSVMLPYVVVLHRMAPLLRWASARDVGNTAWAYATLRVSSINLLPKLLGAAASLPSEPIALVNLLWAAAVSADVHANRPDHGSTEQPFPMAESLELQAEVVQLLERPHISAMLLHLEGTELARAAWALGALRQDHPPLFKRAVKALNLENARTQCLANILWALARVGRQAPAAFHHELQRRAPLPAPELCASLWALAAMRDSGASPLWQDAMAALQGEGGKLSSQAVSTILWAHATVASSEVPLQLCVAAHAAELPHYGPRALANSLWALARLRAQLTAADAIAALDRQAGFKAQEFSNVLWALSRGMPAVAAPPQLQFFEAVAVPLPATFQDQHIANVLWAFATASVRRMDVIPDLVTEVCKRTSLGLQASANIAWALATLCVQAPKLVDHLRLLVSGRLQGARASEFAPQVALSLLGFLWATGTHRPAEVALRCMGAEQDRAAAAAVAAAAPEPSAITLPRQGPQQQQHRKQQQDLQYQPQQMPSGDHDSPRVVLETPGAVVLFKPVNWEVDSDTGVSPGAQRLSSFLAASALPSSVVSCLEHAHGFVSRLDTPSSGLVLQSTCYEGFYDLCIQRELGMLQRDYIILCHGCVPGDRSITARIQKVPGGTSRPSLQGRPAHTRIKVLAHAERVSAELSLVLATIITGRTHQIRCHMWHIGHPVVCDWRYGTKDDAAWCGRNFLHRHRLVFSDLDGTLRSMSEPLPPDLRRVLRALTAVPRGQTAVDAWLQEASGVEQCAWDDWQGFGEGSEAHEPLELTRVFL